MVEDTRAITGGVNTHADMYVAAALDPVGGLLGVREFPATAAGYAELPGWLSSSGTAALAGVEGTGSYGAGLARYLAAAAGGAAGPVRRALHGRAGRRDRGAAAPAGRRARLRNRGSAA